MKTVQIVDPVTNVAKTFIARDVRGMTARQRRKTAMKTPRRTPRAAADYRAAKRAALRTGAAGGMKRPRPTQAPYVPFPQFLGRGFYVPAGPHANLGRRPRDEKRYPHEAGYLSVPTSQRGGPAR